MVKAPIDSSDNPAPLAPARLHWNEEGVPSSTLYGDVYYSRESGLRESEYVFLEQNELPRRWAALDPDRPGCFVIGETGFGTGLNVLLAMRLWRQRAVAGWRLHIISVEKHPLTRTDLQRALHTWPQLATEAAALIDQYPPLQPGQHRLQFDDGHIVLDLLFGDAASGFRQALDTTHPLFAATCGAKVDAWFLDGFAPASNPEMWQSTLFNAIALLSKPGTSFATFTAAGEVRRGLAAQGFDVHKVAGFGRKRDMLRGELQQQPEVALPHPDPMAWHAFAAPKQPRQVAIIGAGLAGAHTAQALARRGIEVTVIDRHPAPAEEASGNPQGILYTRLSHSAGLLNRFTVGSFLHALRHYAPWLARYGDAVGDRCGVLQLMQGDTARGQLSTLAAIFADQSDWVQFVDADSASRLAGVAVAHPAVWFPGAGWLRPREVCRLALDHAAVRFVGGRTVAALQREGEQWLLCNGDGDVIACADAVVIANSHAATRLAPSAWLPLKPIRGQLTYVDAGLLAATPRCVICHDGYTAPPMDGVLTLGATFAPGDGDTDLRGDDDRDNLRQLRAAVPALLDREIQPAGARAALRCASPDYLPLAGALPDRDRFTGDYAALRHHAHARIDAAGAYLPGLYVNVAHGSRGLTSTPLCAELVAALICGDPRPLPSELMRALAPGRFLIRSLVRNQLPA